MSGTLSELISVIVPVYNIEDYLPKCLETICHQTYRNLEIILVDDGSTDSSGRICDEFAERDSRAKVIHQKNGGQGNARNAGQSIAKGDYIMFVDGDDYIHLETVRLLYEAISKNQEYEMAMMNYKETTSHDEDISTFLDFSHTELSRPELIEGYFSGNSLFNPVWNKLYKRHLIQDIWSHNYKRGQDSDFALRVIFNTHKAIWIKSPLYFYYQRAGSITHTASNALIGYQCHAQFLYDNICNLSQENSIYIHFLLRDLYRVMINYVTAAWYTDHSENAQTLCRQYEKNVRSRYWNDCHFSFIEKVAMTLNVCHPRLVRSLKKHTRGRFSWHMLSKF